MDYSDHVKSSKPSEDAIFQSFKRLFDKYYLEKDVDRPDRLKKLTSALQNVVLLFLDMFSHGILTS